MNEEENVVDGVSNEEMGAGAAEADEKEMPPEGTESIDADTEETE